MFPRVDLEDIRIKTRLKERATEDGGTGNPITDNEQPTACELDICGRFEDIGRRYIRDYQGMVTTYQGRIAELAHRADLQILDNKMRQDIGEMEADVQKNITNPLFQNQNLMEATKDSILHFREKHRLLGRVPEVPPSVKNTYALVIIFFVVEAILSYVLMETAIANQERMTVSVIYCFINLGIAFWLGGHARNVNHINMSRRASGWAIVGILVICSLFVNFLIGHYRAAALEFNMQQSQEISSITQQDLGQLIVENTRLSQAAWDSFAEGPLELDAIAWFLTVFGFFCCAVSFQKGYKSEDRYPGYSEQYSQWIRVFNSFVDEVEEGISDLQKIRRDAANEIKDLIETLDNEVKRIPTLIGYAGNSKKDCELAMTVLNTDCNHLVQEYRGINMSSRTTPPPNFFGQSYLIDMEVPPLPNFKEITNQAEINERLQFFANRLHDYFTETIRNIENTQSVLKNEYPFRILVEGADTNG